MRVAKEDAQSLESVTEGAPSGAGEKQDAPHAGAGTGYRSHHTADRGVTGETSAHVDPATQHTVDEAERPGARIAPGAGEVEPAPPGGTHNRPELKTGPEDENAGSGEVGR
jgi:hypothetical protein